MIRLASRNANVKDTTHIFQSLRKKSNLSVHIVISSVYVPRFLGYTRNIPKVDPEGGTVNHQGHTPSTSLKLYMG